MPGKEKKPSPFDAYLPKPKEPLKKEEKAEEMEKKSRESLAGREKTFLYRNVWGEDVLMREIHLPVSFEVEESGEKVEQTYKFVFSPGGWELWREKKEYLLEGLRKILAIAYRHNIPLWVVFVLKEKPQKEGGEYFYSVVIGADGRGKEHCLAVLDEMEREFRKWRWEWLTGRDIHLGEKLTIATSPNFNIDFLIRDCV